MLSNPYYYNENPQLTTPNQLIFQLAKEKIAKLQQVYDSPIPSSNIDKKTIENSLQFPNLRENCHFLQIPDKSIKNDKSMKYDKNNENSANNQFCENEAKSEILMNRLQLNEFLFKKDENVNYTSNFILEPDYSNIKEYKYSQTHKNYENIQKNEFFQENNGNLQKPLNLKKKQDFYQSQENEENRETVKKSANFLTPNKKGHIKNNSSAVIYKENQDFIEEFPLDELKKMSVSKKKKKIFDISNISPGKTEDLPKNVNPLEKIKNSYSKNLQVFKKKCFDKKMNVISPEINVFSEKFKILDKNGEDKSKIFLKNALLEDGAILFENFEVKIGMRSTLSESVESENKSNGLLIFLYYCNKNRTDLKNCSLKFEYSKTLKKVKIFPSIYDFTIEGNSTKRQDFFLEAFEPDDDLINLTLEYKNEAYSQHKIPQKIQFPLPITVNKFMEFKPIDSTIFKNKWRYLKSNISITEPLSYDRHIIMIYSDILRYFPFLIDLNSIKIKKNKENKIQPKWGGLFTINGQKDFLIKIRIIDDDFICFAISDQEDNQNFSKKILETLCFIFCQNY